LRRWRRSEEGNGAGSLGSVVNSTALHCAERIETSIGCESWSDDAASEHLIFVAVMLATVAGAN
jgi:hypothetical protein